jgi:hypothetical protein
VHQIPANVLWGVAQRQEMTKTVAASSVASSKTARKKVPTSNGKWLQANAAKSNKHSCHRAASFS